MEERMRKKKSRLESQTEVQIDPDREDLIRHIVILNVYTTWISVNKSTQVMQSLRIRSPVVLHEVKILSIVDCCHGRCPSCKRISKTATLYKCLIAATYDLSILDQWSYVKSEKPYRPYVKFFTKVSQTNH